MAKIDPQSVEVKHEDCIWDAHYEKVHKQSRTPPRLVITLVYAPKGWRYECHENWRTDTSRRNAMCAILRADLAREQYDELRKTRHGCFDRAPLQKTLEVQDGWGPADAERPWLQARDMKVIASPFEDRCHYTHTALGQTDPRCRGCIHAVVGETQQPPV